MDNYDKTMGIIPGCARIPGLNPKTALTGAGVAPLIGGLTWTQAVAYSGNGLVAMHMP